MKTTLAAYMQMWKDVCDDRDKLFAENKEFKEIIKRLEEGIKLGYEYDGDPS